MAKQKTNTATSNNLADFKDLADYLQQTRRNRKLSVRKVSQICNLPESTIRALERPNRSTLPHSNILGLYLNYAESLDVPASRVRRMVAQEADIKPSFSLRRLPKLKSLVVFSNIGVSIGIFITVVGVLTYAAWQGFGIISSPSLRIDFPDREYIVVDESSFDVRGSAQRESTVLVNGEPTTVDAQTGDFSQRVFLQAGYNYITIEVVNSFSTKTIESFVVVYQPSTVSA